MLADIGPVRILRWISPKPHTNTVAEEAVIRHQVVTSMLDGNRFGIVAKCIPNNGGVVGVTAPNPMPALGDQVVHKLITAEGGLDAIGWRMRKVIPVEEVVITATAASVHRVLTRPEEKAIPAVRDRVVSEDIVG